MLKIFLIFLLLSTPGRAEEMLEFYGGYGSTILQGMNEKQALKFWENSLKQNPKSFIPIVPSAYCHHFLGEIVPKQKIVDGLNAMGEIQNGQTTPNEELSCLENIALEWNSLYPQKIAQPKTANQNPYGSTVKNPFEKAFKTNPENGIKCPPAYQSLANVCVLKGAGVLNNQGNPYIPFPSDSSPPIPCPDDHIEISFYCILPVKETPPAVAATAAAQPAKIQVKASNGTATVTAELDAYYVEWAREYMSRRLLSFYTAHIKKGGKAEDVSGVCQNFERQQDTNRAYAKIFGSHSFDVDPFRWKIAAEIGMSESEISGIRNYTGSYYREINQAIWAGKAKEEKHKIFIEAASAGLDRMPSYKGTVIRDVRELPKPVLEAHQVGKIVTYDAFTSTSKRPNWVWSSSGHRFVIYAAKRGKYVKAVSSNPGEEEVLFPPNTRFKVLSREIKFENSGKPNFNFVLAEVDDEGNVIGEPAPEPGK